MSGETLTIHNIDPELLDVQRRLLVRLIWKDASSPLWGLVEMLDQWSDKRFPDRIYVCTRCGSDACDGDSGRFIIPVSNKAFPHAWEQEPCDTRKKSN